MYFISQYGQHDCLFACLTMMLANYNKDRNFLFLPHEDKMYSYREVIDEAAKYDMKLSGIKVNGIEELRKCQKFPIIVTFQIDRNHPKHSVLLLKVGAKYVRYYDPSGGLKREKVGNFSMKWTRTALIVEESRKTSCPFTPPDFVAKKDKITLPILQIMSGVCLLVATYFIDKEYSMIIPISLFSGFLIFELLFRQNLINAMKRMDEYIYSYDVKEDKEHFPELYQDIEKYRYSAMASFPNFLYSGLIILFIAFILLLNSRYNVLYIATSMLVGAVEVYLFNPYFKMQSEEISQVENNIREAENSYEFIHYSKEAHEKSYKVGLYKTFSSYGSIAFLLAVIIIVMVLTQTISVTYVVFYLCITIFMKNEFSKIFMYSVTGDSDNTLKNKVIQYLKIE